MSASTGVNPIASRKRPRSSDTDIPRQPMPSASSPNNTSAQSANASSRRHPILSDSSNIVQQGQKLVHTPTGYTWERDEDAPGYSWKTKKAIEEYSRAMDHIIDKDLIIGKKYGDIGLDEVKPAP